MSQAHKFPTYEDLLVIPEHHIGQIVEGVLHAHPRPASPHARAASVLGSDLSGPFDRGRGGPGGWLILDEPELHLGADILVPDLAAWRRERMPEMPHAAFFTLAPDWVCEILSPSTNKLDRGPKRRVYAREKVRHLWFVDPTDKTLEVFRLEGESYLLVLSLEDDGVARIEPFEAIELELGALWSR
jgi:Uma2 family endonuclease